MSGDEPPRRPDNTDDPVADTGRGWTILGYLIGGMAVWGFVGWLVDRWLDGGGIPTAVGILVGIAGGIYLVVKRLRLS